MVSHPIRYLVVANVLAGILFYVLIFSGAVEGTNPINISTPDDSFKCGVKTYLNGLTEIAFDTDQNGIADQFTLTRQYRSQPLFYAQDANEDGNWEMVFKDIAEDGINGNEVEYLRSFPAGN